MRKLKELVAVLAVVLGGVASGAQAPRDDTPGEFDYYVLSLSWSPTFCASPAGRRSPEQCGQGRSFGFVIHGLWPQFAQGGFPSSCQLRPEAVPTEVVEKMMPSMPSKRLISHEWEKHGTCSGLDVEEYFNVTEEAFQRVALPEPLRTPRKIVTGSVTAIERLFMEENPGLDPEEIAVVCNGQTVSEIRICMDKELNFRTCGRDVRDTCKEGRARFPPIRK
ncbi:ribonuclease T2 [Archangium lansingense]|uniref:Ribonuclease T2 n=1 Tax=Archangium lansingense TaxID=2995310 RepID=A0ABT4AB35_9BACT|nr:ribonuclease T2 [Archangium lansinium]MCY1078887.1 ribonuclease T2 [Archangium lansinium]